MSDSRTANGAIPMSGSTAAAIANFKPTPREVISGIAPHVFDDRRKRRRRSRPIDPYNFNKNGEAKSSPLRFSAVVTWDDEASFIFLEQADDPPGASHEARHTHGEIQPKASRKKNKPRWKSFHILKTIVIKLRPSSN